MKILDIVKFNDGVAFVVDEMPTLTYEKMSAPVSACEGEYEKFAFAGREFLIGSDESGVFYAASNLADGKHLLVTSFLSR